MADFKKLTVNLSLFSTDQSFKSPNSTSKSPRNFENTELVGLGIVAAMNNVVVPRHDESSRAVVLAVTPARSNSNSNPIPIISDEKSGSKFEDETNLMELSVETTVAAACLVSGVFSCGEFQTADFLNSCFLCTKNLQGLDIFMYRGEKAFCSAECRSQQMASDAKCGSKTKKWLDYSVSPCSPCSGPMMFAVAAA